MIFFEKIHVMNWEKVWILGELAWNHPFHSQTLMYLLPFFEGGGGVILWFLDSEFDQFQMCEGEISFTGRLRPLM